MNGTEAELSKHNTSPFRLGVLALQSRVANKSNQHELPVENLQLQALPIDSIDFASYGCSVLPRVEAEPNAGNART